MSEEKNNEAKMGSGKTTMDGGWPSRFAHIRPKTIPVLEFPGGFVMNESSTIVAKLEAEYPQRPSVPPSNNEALQFINLLVEDFADEWLTKVMYGMRWNRPNDQKWSSHLLAMNASPHVDSETVAKMASFVASVQSDRTALVGCEDSTIHPTFHAFGR
jgi:glutathione S-transferase